MKPSKASANHPSVIFLTGTTGFVGAFLLAELLRVYPSHCRMICLVRCGSSIDPLQRLRERMISYQIWNRNDEHRLIALRGDLSKSSFGLDEQVFQSLVDQIDLIFHCAANVNFIRSAHQPARDNVFGGSVGEDLSSWPHRSSFSNGCRQSQGSLHSSVHGDAGNALLSSNTPRLSDGVAC